MEQTENNFTDTATLNNPSSYYSSFDNRLHTYWNWPKTESLKTSLALAGFIYTGQEDVVMCPFCKVEGFRWETTDNPMDDHRSWSPNCPFLGNTTQNRSVSGQDTCGLYGIEIVRNSIPLNVQRLGVTKSRPPYHPQRVTLHSRFETFKMWPKALKQKPEQLVEAGFFYNGTGDQTICFYCGGGLNEWAETDDPWEQHALWFSNCPFLYLKKGPEFISEVNNQNRPQPHYSGNINTETEESAHSSSEKCGECSRHEEQTIHQTRVCKICFDKELSILFSPCGHIVTCADCAVALKICAVCREPITQKIRTLFS